MYRVSLLQSAGICNTLSLSFSPEGFPSSVQTSLTQNCLKLTIPWFPFNLLPVSLAFFKKKTKSSTVLAWKFPLGLSYSAEWSGQLCQPSAGSNGRLARLFFIRSTPNDHYYLQRAVKPDPASSNSKKSTSNGPYYLQRAVRHDWMFRIILWENIKVFFKNGETLWGHNTEFIFDEYVKPSKFYRKFSEIFAIKVHHQYLNDTGGKFCRVQLVLTTPVANN